MFEFDGIVQWGSYAGVFVFAATGALAAAERGLDILAYFLFGMIVGTGGGTIRDVLLDVPVFWIDQPVFLYLCGLAGLSAFFAAKLLQSVSSLLLWLDAWGIAFFSVLGTAKAQSLGVDPAVALVMGVVTATFGSIIRDVILNREPLILGPEIYVTTTLVGTGSFLALRAYEVDKPLAVAIAVALAFSLRAAAILFDWRLPVPSAEVSEPHL